MPNQITIAPKNAATGERETWEIPLIPMKALEPMGPVQKSRKGTAPKPYHKPVPDPEMIRRVNHEHALEDIRRKKLQKLLKQQERMEKRLDVTDFPVDVTALAVAAERVEEEQKAYALKQRLTPLTKTLLECIEELRMAPLWVEERGIANPRDMHCTEKKWDWFQEVEKKLIAAHPFLQRLWRANDYTTPTPIIQKFTLLTRDFDDLCTHIEDRVQKDSLKNQKLRKLEKYLKRMEGIFGELDVAQHVTYLKTQLVHAKLDFALGIPQM
ncbi:hypothetical protein WOLCODRAFT_155170 [Wolfiporia cocos MD-104 SS10]|uniref:Uncharacterized protein n=1 Tax=Wolfiporia cocos (strain MD-104) TaxID=742152 RepID=A0A2H3JA20_WOLCO|nr:hypothetical protein WOLCODRAFT_155170 [Wolfiporia cocos MD-104 SS10]